MGLFTPHEFDSLVLLPLKPGGIHLGHNVPCLHVAIHALGETGLMGEMRRRKEEMGENCGKEIKMKEEGRRKPEEEKEARR